MERVYKTSRILACVLAVVALLGIVSVADGIVRDGIEQKYNLDIDTQDTSMWLENWHAYEAECQSNTTLRILDAVSTALIYLRIICIYGGMYLFFLFLRKNMAKGSRLALTITIGLVAATSCFCIFMLANYIIDVLGFGWYRSLCVICMLLLISTFCMMLRFFPPQSIQRITCILLIITVFLNSVTFIRLISFSWVTVMGTINTSMIFLYPLAFAFFYFEFSKLKK